MTNNANERDQLIAQLKQAAHEAMSTKTKLEHLAWAMLLEDMREIKDVLVRRGDGTDPVDTEARA